MPRMVGFKCKTEGCPAWFPLSDVPEDTNRTIHFVLRLNEEPRRLQCPDCGQAHDYLPEDKQLVKVAAE